MRRLVATALMVASSWGMAGCGLLQADLEPRTELGPLETFKGPGFRIGLPCAPSEQSVDTPVAGGPAVTTTTWMCDAGVSAYSVSRTPFARGLRVDLDAIVQGAADGVGGTIASDTPVKYAGSRGRDIRIETTYKRQTATVFQRVLIRKRSMIQVQAVLAEERIETSPPTYVSMLASLSFR